MKSYDVIVIGAGIAGLCAARELAKRKQKVLVVEPEAPGGAASRAAAGILDPYTEAEQKSPLLALGMRALEFYPSFLDEISRRPSTEVEYEKLGILYLALNAKDEKFLKSRYDWQVKQGLPVEFHSREETKKMEPQVSEKTLSSVSYPGVPKLNARKLLDQIFKAAQAAGVEIKTGAKGAEVWIEGGKIRGVKIGSSSMGAPALVYAAGCWTRLNEIVGISRKVTPVRGQILILKSNRSLYPNRMLHTLRWAYLIPWPGERLLVGSTLEAGEFENCVTPEGQEDILNRVSEMMEGIRMLPVESSWSGLRPFVEGGMPVIGPTGIPGLFLAAGYYRSGILIAPLVGKLLAEGMLSRSFSPLLKPFLPKKREEKGTGTFRCLSPKGACPLLGKARFEEVEQLPLHEGDCEKREVMPKGQEKGFGFSQGLSQREAAARPNHPVEKCQDEKNILPQKRSGAL